MSNREMSMSICRYRTTWIEEMISFSLGNGPVM
jgi:hypothetical protein